MDGTYYSALGKTLTTVQESLEFRLRKLLADKHIDSRPGAAAAYDEWWDTKEGMQRALYIVYDNGGVREEGTIKPKAATPREACDRLLEHLETALNGAKLVIWRRMPEIQYLSPVGQKVIEGTDVCEWHVDPQDEGCACGFYASVRLAIVK